MKDYLIYSLKECRYLFIEKDETLISKNNKNEIMKYFKIELLIKDA